MGSTGRGAVANKNSCVENYICLEGRVEDAERHCCYAEDTAQHTLGVASKDPDVFNGHARMGEWSSITLLHSATVFLAQFFLMHLEQVKATYIHSCTHSAPEEAGRNEVSVAQAKDCHRHQRGKQDCISGNCEGELHGSQNYGRMVQKGVLELEIWCQYVCARQIFASFTGPIEHINTAAFGNLKWISITAAHGHG